MNDRKHIFKGARRIVVKIGSNVLTAPKGLNLPVIRSVSRQVSELMQTGREVIMVSSGAMASGMKKIQLAARPVELPKRQAVAAVGQPGLMLEYEKAFARFNQNVAQILLTSDDLASRKRHLNARNTLNTLLAWKILPIINENDTVAVEEIEFGDNDNLAAMIALLMDAQLLINLTDIDGLYTRDPRSHGDAELLERVTRIDRNTEKYASDIPGALGTGGMISKIKAARKLNAAGIPMVIARGDSPDVLLDLTAGKPLGTYFVPREEKLRQRKCWLAFSVKPEGALTLDDGAVKAVVKNGKSLLPSGIIAVESDFRAGAAVEFRSRQGKVIGIGLVNYSSVQIRKICGLRSDEIVMALGQKTYDEVIHRDNLAVTLDEEN